MFRSLFAKSPLTKSRKRRDAKPSVETLEQRAVPSVSQLFFSGSTLVVKTDNAATSVTVYSSGTNYVIKEVGTTKSWTYAASSITQVEFQGGAGNDRFVNDVYNLNTRAFGNGGDDYLEGYNGVDIFVGGDGNDTLVGYGGNDQMWGGNGNDTLKGMAGDDILVGDAGDDRLIGGDGNDTLYGGDGNDTLVGGAGKNTLYAGNGDDTLVTINNGTTDFADGGAGRDTVWQDANRTYIFWIPITTTDTAINAEVVHNVFGFANGADRTLDGDAIAEPTDGANYKNFANNPLFGAGGPSVNDIDQNALGDCWMMATLGSVANDHPYAIRQIVADFGDGTYGVQLGNNFYREDASLPTLNATSNTPTYAGLGNNGSLWVALVEKAYTSYRTGANTYASLNNGDPADALRAVNASSVGENYYAAGSNSTTLANDIYSHWNAYQSCTLCTGTVPTGSLLIGNHCYTVTSVSRDATGRVTSITLRNPWGPDNTSGNPYLNLTPSQLASCQLWVAFGNT